MQAPSSSGCGKPPCLPTSLLKPCLPAALARENSCRKEVAPLLARYLQQCSSAGGSAEGVKAGEGAALPSAPLAAVKVACQGVVALKLGTDSGGALVQQVAAALLSDIDSGKQARLQHVQRMIPVQATCELSREALQAAGARLAPLAAAHVAQAGATAAPGDDQQQQQKVTFGIALKHRPLQAGGESAEGGSKQPPETGTATAAAAAAATSNGDAGGSQIHSAGGSGQEGLGRGDIIRTLAAGFEAALRLRHDLKAEVDLKNPELVLVAEVLPAGGDLYAALCVLPRSMCVVKPRLHIRPVGKAM